MPFPRSAMPELRWSCHRDVVGWAIRSAHAAANATEPPAAMSRFRPSARRRSRRGDRDEGHPKRHPMRGRRCRSRSTRSSASPRRRRYRATGFRWKTPMPADALPARWRRACARPPSRRQAQPHRFVHRGARAQAGMWRRNPSGRTERFPPARAARFGRRDRRENLSHPCATP